MRVPRGVANANKRFTNPLARSVAAWLPGLGTLEHVGRTSGRQYRTPLLVFPTRDGYAFLIGYGHQSDWVKNVLAGGPVTLHERGTSVELTTPTVVSKAEAALLVAPGWRRFFGLFPYDEAALLLNRA